MISALWLWATLMVLAVVFAPLAHSLFRPLPGAGVGVAAPLGLLVVGFPLWLAASLGIVPYTSVSARGVFVATVLLGAAYWWRTKPGLNRVDRALLIWSLIVLTVAFALALGLLSFSPDLWLTERPMDLAMVSAVNANTSFPSNDLWLSGAHLNYYYFGHFLSALLLRITGAAPEDGYLPAMAATWAMAASAVFGLGAALVAGRRTGVRAPLVGGGIALMATMFSGNPWSYRLLMDHDGSLKSFNWFAASRAMPGTINDFPFFSLLVGDLHAHVIAVPFTVLGLWAVYEHAAFGVGRGWRLARSIVCTALCVGALWSMHAWSVPIFVGLLTGAVVYRSVLARDVRVIVRGGAWLLSVLAGGFLLFLPFHVGYRPDAGLAVVRDHTSLTGFARNTAFVYGGLLVLTLPALLVLVRRPLRATWAAAEWFVVLLVAGGLAGIVLPELFFVPDIWKATELFRMNTVFKIGYQTWILLGIASGPLIVWVFPTLRRSERVLGVAALSALAAGGLLFPVVGSYASTRGFAGPPRLDMLERLDAAERAGVAWLRTHTSPDAVVLEAVLDDYTFASTRMSTLSGRATVIGWADHERVWGNDPGARREDVAEIYDTGSLRRAASLMRRYSVDYVVVGALERGTYSAPGLAKFSQLGSLVFRAADTSIYRVV